MDLFRSYRGVEKQKIALTHKNGELLENVVIQLSEEFQKLIKAEKNNLELTLSYRGENHAPFLHLDPKTDKQKHDHFLYNGWPKYRSLDLRYNMADTVKMSQNETISLPSNFVRRIIKLKKTFQLYPITIYGARDHIRIIKDTHMSKKVMEAFLQNELTKYDDLEWHKTYLKQDLRKRKHG